METIFRDKKKPFCRPLPPPVVTPARTCNRSHTMRTLSTVAILALAFTGANAATYTGDGAVPNSGSVQVGTAGACPVRVPARQHISRRSLRERVGHDAPRARALGSSRERARPSAAHPLRSTRSSALPRRGR